MRKAVFFSGAGLSADSGLGTFRGSDGLWDKYDPNKVCSYRTWRDNYDLVHEFYNKRRLEYASAEPNAMHKAIARLQRKYGVTRVKVITQNIDDLLERAGCSEVLHVHGRIGFVRCEGCGLEKAITGEFLSGKCEKCGSGIFKPSVVFFGEAAPAYEPMYREIASLDRGDMIAVIGTEGSVIPISSILGDKTRGVPARRILCNLDKSPYIRDEYFDVVLYGRAADLWKEVSAEAEAVLDNE